MIEITQQPDYTFSEPAYHFGQNLVDCEQDEGFVIAMRFTDDEWEYSLFYRKLETVGQWIPESALATGIHSL